MSHDSLVLVGPRVRLRATRDSDVPRLVDLRNNARDSFYDSSLVDVASTTRWLQVSAGRGELNWVILQGGQVIGTASAIPQQDEVEIGRIVLDPECRGKGLMREALELILGYVRERYALPVFLEVKPDNGPAISLYERLGFRAIRLRMEQNDSAV